MYAAAPFRFAVGNKKEIGLGRHGDAIWNAILAQIGSVIGQIHAAQIDEKLAWIEQLEPVGSPAGSSGSTSTERLSAMISLITISGFLPWLGSPLSSKART